MSIACNELQQTINSLLISFKDCNKIKNSDLRKLVELTTALYACSNGGGGETGDIQHNATENIQGGSLFERFHLTEEEHDNLEFLTNKVDSLSSEGYTDGLEFVKYYTTVKAVNDGLALKVKLFIKSNESLSLAQRKDDIIYGILDQYTGEEMTLSKVTGTPTPDGIIYFQLGSEYFKRNFIEVDVKWFAPVVDFTYLGLTFKDITLALKKAVTSFNDPSNIFFGDVKLKLDYGVYWLRETMFVPQNISIDFNSSSIRPAFDGTMFCLNAATVGGNWLMDGSQFTSLFNHSIIKNLNLNNYNLVALPNARAFYTVSRGHLTDINIEGFRTAITYGDSFFNSGLGLNINYVDARYLKNIQINNSTSLVNEYDVILHQGDVNVIENCLGGKWSFDRIYTTSVISSYFEKTRIMNSSIEFNSFSSEKFTPILIFRSNVVISNSIFGAKNRDTSIAQLGGLPFIKVDDENPTDYNSSSAPLTSLPQRTNLSLNNVQLNLNNSYVKTTDIKDFIFGKCSLLINNVSYLCDDYGLSFSTVLAPSTDIPLKIEDFKSIKKEVIVNNFDNSTDAFFAEQDGFYTKAGVMESNDTYYKGHFLFDVERRLGGTRLYEVSVIGNTTRNSIMMRINREAFNNLGESFYIELYKGSVSDTYTKKVVVPILASNVNEFNNYLFDNGLSISNNVFWQSRTAGTFDAINDAFSKILYNGGNCTVVATALPTVGNWQIDDKCIIGTVEYRNTVNGTPSWVKIQQLKSYTVSNLPSGTLGDTACVTDATAPTYLGTLTGGGAVNCPVFYNGVAWVSH